MIPVVGDLVVLVMRNDSVVSVELFVDDKNMTDAFQDVDLLTSSGVIVGASTVEGV